MASTLTWLVVIPLINFDSDVSEINFGDLLLQPLAPEEKTAFGDIYFLDRMISLLELSQTQFKLAGSYKTEIDEPRSSAELIASATEIVTAMRLLKAGDAGASAAFERGTSTLSSGIGAQQMRETQTRGWFMGAAYHLEEADVPALLTIKSTLARGRNSFVRPLAVALRRFNQAYARETAEDRLIDLTVCLESCLLSGVEDELKYRLSLRAAALLADHNDPERTQVMLNAVYQARSSIVHSGKQLSDVAAMMKSLGGLTPAVQPHELPQHCEDLVRKVLMAYLTHLSAGRSVADINKDLDRKIVRSLRAEFPSERQ